MFFKRRNLVIGGYLVFMTLMFNACVEPFDIETKTFDSALVIEGAITDKVETQQIKLSRTFRLESDRPAPENSASVKVVGDDGNEYPFTSVGDGIYESNNQFSAQQGVNYSLNVTTQEGGNYASKPAMLSGSSTINNISAIQTSQPINGQESEGVAILVDSGNSSSNNSYYRYSYDETYEVRSKYNIPIKLAIVDSVLTIVTKDKQDHICYTTKPSQELILANTNMLSSNNISKFPVRFISKNNRILAFRYSILVKQFSLSREAYEFYEILNELSGSESLFSQNQPGFINGNVYSVDNPEEKVIGYFSVSPVDSKRFFFSFTDFFDVSERPESEFDCSITRPEYPTGDPVERLENLIESGAAQLVGRAGQPNPEEGIGPYRIADSRCIDCTLFGTTDVPEFWTE